MPFRAGSTQSSSSSSSSPRIMQTMDGATSRSHSSESAGIPLLVPPLPDISTIPVVPCGLCPVPLRTPYTAIAPSDLIHSLMTICQHSFHHICYMNYITTAPADTRAFCPQCQANILTKERFWVHATTHTGNECYTDMTDDIEQQLLALRTARQQILIDMLSYRNFQIAAPLLVGPEAVDVNYRSTKGGFTPLHVCAVQNDVEAIDLLLR
ncbi:hypothetical protein B0H11DRAFT_716743 [Mycena galericulata]|nr:hypothetical protein B0H11DRAFT_716743 [Mycena galericulata]